MSAEDEYVPFADDLPPTPPDVKALQEVERAIHLQTDRLESELMELRENLEIRGRFRGVGEGVFFVLGLFGGVVLAALL